MAGTKAMREAKILLRNTGNYAIVDERDYEYVNSFSPWYENDNGYVMKKTRQNGKNVSIRLHRLIAQPPKGLVVDHINGNKLDNRRENLRCVSSAINAWNREQTNKHTRYDLPAGVSFDKSRNKYVATRTIRRRFNTLAEAVNFTKESEVLDYGR